MRIRILQMLDSGVDGCPFMPGQVIDVANPAPWLLSYLDGEKAEVLRADEPELAVASAAPERAVQRKAKR